MESTDDKIDINKMEIVLNNNVILGIFVIFGLSIILSGFLSYIFSHSIITIVFGMIIGVTIGIMFNYYIIRSKKLIKDVIFEIENERDENEKVHTTMKFWIFIFLVFV